MAIFYIHKKYRNETLEKKIEMHNTSHLIYPSLNVSDITQSYIQMSQKMTTDIFLKKEKYLLWSAWKIPMLFLTC